MDSKFIAMKRTIALLEKYDQKLPEMTEKFYTAAPQRYALDIPKWRNNHRMALKETNDQQIFGISNTIGAFIMTDFLSKNCVLVCHYRWNNLKMKVNQAKQRLGPRIQAEASSVTQVIHML